ncbi:MAG: hypothetical protein LBT50_05775 [Prevotellaceae bacterium]|jgi:hypothetical protein|nr:hypothetical protein [Prevotellaceae bacterium]
MLPSLLAKGIVPIGDGELEEYKEQYLKMFDKYVVEDNEVNRLNMRVQPEKSLELCKGINEIVSSENLNNKIGELSKRIAELKARGTMYKKVISSKNDYKF